MLSETWCLKPSTPHPNFTHLVVVFIDVKKPSDVWMLQLQIDYSFIFELFELLLNPWFNILPGLEQNLTWLWWALPTADASKNVVCSRFPCASPSINPPKKFWKNILKGELLRLMVDFWGSMGCLKKNALFHLRITCRWIEVKVLDPWIVSWNASRTVRRSWISKWRWRMRWRMRMRWYILPLKPIVAFCWDMHHHFWSSVFSLLIKTGKVLHQDSLGFAPRQFYPSSGTAPRLRWSRYRW